jgi:NAD(P)H dehydrogenase (quinone)
MSISLILAHPRPGSFNHAIAAAALQTLRQNGHHVSFHDLCMEGFDPVMPYLEIPKSASLDPVIQNHCNEIAQAEGIIIVHPNWWGQPPAILKGWIDRVIRPGVAYEFLEGDSGEGVPRGLLQAKAALVFNTSNTEPERERKIFGDPLETLWKNCIFDLCGVKDFYRKTYSIIATSTMNERVVWLENVTETVNRYFPNQEEI